MIDPNNSKDPADNEPENNPNILTPDEVVEYGLEEDPDDSDGE